MKTIYLTNRDIALLNALWKWKMLTAAAIWKGFFPDRNPQTSYARLWQLQLHKYIERRSISSSGREFVWILSRKGFNSIKDYIPNLSECGYLSENIIHDHYVTAVHAGDWLIKRPEGIELFSEQELRRINPEAYPEWVPNSGLHRPDGYWHINLVGKNVLVALEIELCQKTSLRYSTPATFYQQSQNIFRVVWVVGSVSLGNRIKKQLELACPNAIGLHNFLLLNQFKKTGWDAPFFLGPESGRPLKDLLNGGSRHYPDKCRATDLLNGRKAPGRSITYKSSTLS